jgi:hypothetical protein
MDAHLRNEPHNKAAISRRQALKALAGLGGSLGTVLILPRRWATPEVKAGVLPAHAQSSNAAFLNVLASWEGIEDVDLMVWDPGDSGEQVDYTNPNGPTATHSGDNIAFSPPRNWEKVTVPPGGAAAGNYLVWVHAHEDVEVPVSLDISTHSDVRSFKVTVPPNAANLTVAKVSFPTGAIAAWNGPLPHLVADKDKPENK